MINCLDATWFVIDAWLFWKRSLVGVAVHTVVEEEEHIVVAVVAVVGRRLSVPLEWWVRQGRLEDVEEELLLLLLLECATVSLVA